MKLNKKKMIDSVVHQQNFWVLPKKKIENFCFPVTFLFFFFFSGSEKLKRSSSATITSSL